MNDEEVLVSYLIDAGEAVEEADRVKKAKEADKAAKAEARRLAAGIPAPSARNLKRKKLKKS